MNFMGLAIVSLLRDVLKWMSCVVLCVRKKRGVGGVCGNDDWRAHHRDIKRKKQSEGEMGVFVK